VLEPAVEPPGDVGHPHRRERYDPVLVGRLGVRVDRAAQLGQEYEQLARLVVLSTRRQGVREVEHGVLDAAIPVPAPLHARLERRRALVGGALDEVLDQLGLRAQARARARVQQRRGHECRSVRLPSVRTGSISDL
jgi:hypothetical protein